MGRDIIRLDWEKIMKKLLILVSLLFLPLLCSAAETPEWYPEKGYELSGMIQQIDVKQRAIVISDDKLVIASIVKVHSLDDEFYSLSRLKIGDVIGVDVAEISGGMVEIVEIWLLDKDKPVLFPSNSLDSSGSSDSSNSSSLSGQSSKKPGRVSPKVTR